MDVLRQDLRHALRALRRDAGFTAAVVFTLAIGIGANTAVFSIVRSTLLVPLPYREADRLAMIWTDIRAQSVREAGSAYANIVDWESQSRAFEDIATYDPTTLTVTDGEWPEQISTARVSANLFAVLDVAPALGRVFSADEETQRARVVVLSHDLWQRRFAASTMALGRTIDLAGNAFEIVGIMPASFGFPDRNTQLWLPQTLFTDWEANAARRGTDSWRAIGRLRKDVSYAEARADMDAVATQLEHAHAANAGLGITIVPLHEQVTGRSYRIVLWMLFGAVTLVLLIACSNAAHMVLARGLDRSREAAVRLALGATTSRMIRLAVTENVLLAFAAALTGLLLAHAGLRLLVSLAPADLPRLDAIGIDVFVLIYAVAISHAAGIVFGALPAFAVARAGLYGVLRAGGGATVGAGRQRGRSLLITFQFALAIILVFGANLLVRSLANAHAVDVGYATDDVFLANLSVPAAERRASFYAQLLEEIQALPGVRAAGLVEDLFISGAPNRAIAIESRGGNPIGFEEIRIDAIAGDLLGALRVPLLDGRGFTASDDADAAPVAIVNETMARRFWPGEAAVGRRFRTGDAQSPWIAIVGVAGDMRRQGAERAPIAQVFRPYAQQPSRNMNLLVHSAVPGATLAATIRARIAALDATVPLYRITTVDMALDRYVAQRRFSTYLLGIFSMFALTLAAAGIYGLMQYSVARRTREMGVRAALGATSGRLAFMMLRHGLALALPGLLLGLLCAFWVSDAIAALFFGVRASDLANIVTTAGILLLASLLACWIPARRAARVEPVTALRQP